MKKFTLILLSAFMTTFMMAQTPTGGTIVPGNYGSTAVALYSQMTPVDSIGAVASQQFTDYSNHIAQIADDFIVPASKRWTIETVATIGAYWNGSGTATSFTVQIYSDNGGTPNLPGTLLYEQTGLSYSQTGNKFDIPLSSNIQLYEGHYWISVFAVMSYAAGGQWGIAWNQSPQINYVFADQDPDQVLGGTWADTWEQSSNYFAGRNNYDLCFELGGTEDAAPVPVSNWAILIGVLLIGTFIAFKYKKRIA